jgi:hypothetical protein
VFLFDEFYGLDATLANDVSDHYPVQLSLSVGEHVRVVASAPTSEPAPNVEPTGGTTGDPALNAAPVLALSVLVGVGALLLLLVYD